MTASDLIEFILMLIIFMVVISYEYFINFIGLLKKSFMTFIKNTFRRKVK